MSTQNVNVECWMRLFLWFSNTVILLWNVFWTELNEQNELKIRKKKRKKQLFLIGQTVLPDRSIDNSPKMTEKAKNSNFLITCKKIQIISIEIIFWAHMWDFSSDVRQVMIFKYLSSALWNYLIFCPLFTRTDFYLTPF